MFPLNLTVIKSPYSIDILFLKMLRSVMLAVVLNSAHHIVIKAFHV